MSMMYIEDWTAVESFYFAVITISTVGYGDFIPSSRAGKLFTVFYVLIGCIYLFKAFTGTPSLM